MKLRDLLPIGAFGVALALAACGASPAASSGPAPVAVPPSVSAGQLAGVTLRIGDQKGSSEQVLLKAAGLLDDIPYHVEWSTFTSGPPMLEAVNSGAVDVGQVGNTPPIFSAAAGGDIGIVAALRPTVGDAVLVPRNSSIHALADLRGKRIAVAKGSSSNGTLLNTLAKAGLKPGDVTINYLQPADAYAAFNQGGVDAWAVWEPYVSQAVQSAGAQQLVSGKDALDGTGPAAGTPLSNGYTFQVASRTALADAGKNTAVGDYVIRIAKADLWAVRHPDEWAAIYAQQTGIPLEVAKAALPGIAPVPLLIDDSVVAAEQQLADAFTAAGQLPGKVGMAAFIDRRFNTAVQPLVGGAK